MVQSPQIPITGLCSVHLPWLGPSWRSSKHAIVCYITDISKWAVRLCQSNTLLIFYYFNTLPTYNCKHNGPIILLMQGYVSVSVLRLPQISIQRKFEKELFLSHNCQLMASCKNCLNKLGTNHLLWFNWKLSKTGI